MWRGVVRFSGDGTGRPRSGGGTWRGRRTDQTGPQRLDLYIPVMSSFLDRAIVIDITIGFPNAACHVRDATRSAGAAATRLESHKHLHYDTACKAKHIALQPLGIDIYSLFVKAPLSSVSLPFTTLPALPLCLMRKTIRYMYALLWLSTPSRTYGSLLPM